MLVYLEKTIGVTASFILIIFFTRFFIVEPGRVDGQSMEPNFKHNQLFITNKIGALILPPSRFTAIQILNPVDHKHLLIKRVVGLPGETVFIKRNTVFIRGVDGIETPITEPYLYPNISIDVKYGEKREFKVPPDSYFVLGDNRPISSDSRAFGAVHRRNIIGTVIAL